MSEEVSDIGDGRALFMVDGFWSVFDCTGEKLKIMNDCIPCRDCGLSKVVMEKLNCIGEEE